LKTNNRFDRLTNLDIFTHYGDIELCLLPNEFLAALAYFVICQNPNDDIVEVKPAVVAFKRHILNSFDDPKRPQIFTYEGLLKIVNDAVFESIPEIMALNQLEPDFIDLGALARNVFFMIVRQCITQNGVAGSEQ